MACARKARLGYCARVTFREALFSLALGLCAVTAGCSDDKPANSPHSPNEDSGAPIPDASVDGSIDAASDAATDAATDAAQLDARVDAASDADVPMPDAEVDSGTPLIVPMLLSETGLYEPDDATVIASNALEYAPRYALWSDGADKRRWLMLPEGEVIDTSDIDAFQFPVGTKAFKEFSRAGTRLETRMLWKTEGGWVPIAYAWNEAQTEATAVPRGASDVLGTTHDIPQRADCRLCHDGASDTLLGVSAIQLSHSGPGITLALLDSAGRLSDSPPANIERPDTLEWNALGSLHANCGSSCHNPAGGPFGRVDLDLALRVGELGDITQTQSYLTTVDVPLADFASSVTMRVATGDSTASGLIVRMQSRGEEASMPPIASEQLDNDGLTLVSDWIDSL